MAGVWRQDQAVCRRMTGSATWHSGQNRRCGMHGGDIYRNHVTLDFSVNINPCGVPSELRVAMEEGLSQVETYPDLTCRELKENIALHFQVNPEQVICGNGASELIMALCHWKRPEKAFLMAPGFSGYEKALKAVDCDITYCYLNPEEYFRPGEQLLQMVFERRPEVLFLSNPANPTGVLLDRDYVRRLCSVCEETGTLLVLDECFMELTGRAQVCSMIPLLSGQEHLVILRAFTKSFAIPGIRLGYLLCGRTDMAEKIQEQLPEWNVSVPAQKAGLAALNLSGYLQKSVEMIAQERSFLSEELCRLGMQVFPSEADFILFYTEDTNLQQKLLTKGILIRDCRDYAGLKAGYYRVAVKKREENLQLLQALKERM